MRSPRCPSTYFDLAFVGRNYDAPAALAEERRVDDRVHFLPPVPPAEVKSFIVGADAAAILYWPITSNFLNALPYRLYQAIAAGLLLLACTRRRCGRRRIAARSTTSGVPIYPGDGDSVLSCIKRSPGRPGANLETPARQRRQAADKVKWERERGEAENALVRALVVR